MTNNQSMANLAYELMSKLSESERKPRKIKTINEDDSELWVMLLGTWPEKFEKTENRKTPWATLDSQLRQDDRFVVSKGFVYLKEWGDFQLESSEEDDEDHLSIKEKALQERFFLAWKSTQLKAFGFGPLRLVDVEEQERKQGHYNTGEVGELDFLFLDSNDDYVVVELKRKDDDKVLGQLLRYMGYVKKNMCKINQDVKGIIITREITQKLLYASEISNKMNIKIYPWFEK